jgi:ribosomal protein S18 acetylase RimI-like enzyme
MSIVGNVKVFQLRPDEIDQASRLLADSMCTNPNHIAIFQSTNVTALAKQQGMFQMVLQDPNNESFVAKADGRILGTMTYASSEHCQLSPGRMLGSMPVLIKLFGCQLLPVLGWRMNWSKHDYRFEHVHFGPLAVDRNFQGRGIGKLLLGHFCSYLDRTAQTGYLETDKLENVTLYERFGFKIIQTDTLFGNPNWFMLRKPLD